MRRIACESVGVLRVASPWLVASRPARGNAHAAGAGVVLEASPALRCPPEPDAVNKLWVGDITYVPLRGGVFCYLAALMDRYSRDIVGWELDETMTEDLTLTALRMAWALIG